MKLLPRQLITLINKASRNNWLAGFFIVLTAGLFAHFVLDSVSVIRLAENYLTDLRIVWLSRERPQSENIAVVLIDEQTLRDLPYRSPVDRALISRLIETLENKSVGAIGLNILFNQPTETDKDLQLYHQLRASKVPIVIAGMSGNSGFSHQQIEYSQTYLEGLHTGLSLIYRDVIDHTVRISLLRMDEPDGVQLGFAAENEANFIGCLATIHHDDIYFNYSGYAFALRHCLNELYKRDKEQYDLLVSKINKGVLKNYQEVHEFWSAYQNPTEPFFRSTYNNFLKANNQADGMQSYSYVVALLVNYFEVNQQ